MTINDVFLKENKYSPFLYRVRHKREDFPYQLGALRTVVINMK